MRGRPRILSTGAEAFLRLYLDPLNSPQEIARACGISLATFYNYEKELDLPHLRVGIGNTKGHLPLHRALASFQREEDLEELNLVRQIAAEMRVRIKLIPLLSSDIHVAPYLVRSRKVDFAIKSISWTKERANDLYFSDHYLPDSQPSGVLMAPKGWVYARQPGRKPVLGVPHPTVHSEYAEDRLQQEFEVKRFRTGPLAFDALRAGRVDFLLLHPSWLDMLPENREWVEIRSKSYIYGSFTGMIFHSDSEHWRKPLNRALGIVLERKHRAKKEGAWLSGS